MADKFLQGEMVYTGDYEPHARTRGYVNYKNDTGQLEIINVTGDALQTGTYLTGVDSGHKQYVWDINPHNRVEGTLYQWDMENTGVGAYLIQDDGTLIALDAHFTGGAAQDQQPTYAVVSD